MSIRRRSPAIGWKWTSPWTTTRTIRPSAFKNRLMQIRLTAARPQTSSRNKLMQSALKMWKLFDSRERRRTSRSSDDLQKIKKNHKKSRHETSSSRTSKTSTSRRWKTSRIASHQLLPRIPRRTKTSLMPISRLPAS